MVNAIGATKPYTKMAKMSHLHTVYEEAQDRWTLERRSLLAGL